MIQLYQIKTLSQNKTYQNENNKMLFLEKINKKPTNFMAIGKVTNKRQQTKHLTNISKTYMIFT